VREASIKAKVTRLKDKRRKAKVASIKDEGKK